MDKSAVQLHLVLDDPRFVSSAELQKELSAYKTVMKKGSDELRKVQNAYKVAMTFLGEVVDTQDRFERFLRTCKAQQVDKKLVVQVSVPAFENTPYNS